MSIHLNIPVSVVNATAHSIARTHWLGEDHSAQQPPVYKTFQNFAPSSHNTAHSSDPLEVHHTLCPMMMRPGIPTSNLMLKPSAGTVSTSRESSPTPSPPTTTDDKIRHLSLTRHPSYHRTHSCTHSPVSSATSLITPKLCAPLLSKTPPQPQSYSTMMQEHQSTRRVMSLDPCPALDLSPYEGRQDYATPTKSWKNVHIAKAFLICLLSAPLSFKERDRQHRGNEQSPSVYPPNLRKGQPKTRTLTTPSNPYQRGLGSLGPN